MTEHPAAPTLPPHPQSNPRERILSRHLREKASIWDIPPSGGADDFRCVRDGESWPCDAVRLARSDLDEARAAARKEVRPAIGSVREAYERGYAEGWRAAADDDEENSMGEMSHDDINALAYRAGRTVGRALVDGRKEQLEALEQAHSLASQERPRSVYLPMDCPVCGRHRVEWDGKVLRCEKCTTSSEWDGFTTERYGSQERPSIDVERLAALLRDHCHDSIDEGLPILLRHKHLAPFVRDDCAAAIARGLSGPVRECQRFRHDEHCTH